jgi:hypothetical protein
VCNEERELDMAVVETDDGSWFPVFALFSEIPKQIFVLEESPLISSARDSLHERGQGYAHREEAIAACHAWCEAVGLTEEWRALAAHTELYPERNAWYFDEIAHLAGDDTPRLYCGSSVLAMVRARGIDNIELIAATGHTPDEPIESLYQRVYEWSWQIQDTTCTHP